MKIWEHDVMLSSTSTILSCPLYNTQICRTSETMSDWNSTHYVI